MGLEIAHIREVLKNPKNKNKVQIAKSHERRISLHSDIALTDRAASKAINDFTTWVRGLLPDDKYNMFVKLLKFPIDTNRLTDEVYQALEKVFDGRDAVYHYTFRSGENEADFEQYRAEKLNEPNVWKDSFAKIKTMINSMVVVDLPSEQKTRTPEPYFYWIDISDVVDFSSTDGKIDWVIFKQGEDINAVYDDEHYRVIKTKNNMVEVLVEEKHDLGYCPVSWFWTDSIKDPDIKKSPLSAYLSQLDWILFYNISKKYGDLYSPWPIYWGYQQDCDYENEDGHYCDGGYLRNTDDHYVVTNRVIQECPICATKTIAGVGSYIEVPPPSEENGQATLTPPVGIVNADVNTLKYNVEEIGRLQRELYQSITGNSYEAIVNQQAINKDQVMALFESRKQVLVKLKANFERIQTFVDSTVARLRYGKGFEKAYVNYGDEFYLFAPEVLLDMYAKAKESKLDHSVLDMLQDQYFETEYRNNAQELHRQRILADLDPFRHLSTEEVRVLYDQGNVENVDYMIKANFSTYLNKFERENVSVLVFGEALEYAQKITKIYEVMKSYVIIPEKALTLNRFVNKNEEEE